MVFNKSLLLELAYIAHITYDEHLVYKVKDIAVTFTKPVKNVNITARKVLSFFESES